MTTKTVRYLYVWLLMLVMLVAGKVTAPAQSAPPQREKLLNGLSILFWPRPGDGNVLLKLRIHSGAAFDLAGKGGTMSLLAGAMFPDADTREYVTEQLGGKLEVTTGYDAIDITISGKASGLERMIELMRNAVVNVNLSADSVTKIKAARLKEFSNKPLSSAELADRAIAERLFGSFPYAHPEGGTIESVSKIERADLLLANERFLHADNASLAVVGGVEKPRLIRALRQLLGPWQKSDRIIPSTFRQPSAPDVRVLVINQLPANSNEVRIAVRGLSRGDTDSAAAQVLSRIVLARWAAAVAGLTSVSVREDEHTLPGIFLLSAQAPPGSTAKAISAAREVMKTLVQTGVTANELEQARGAIASTLNARVNDPESIANSGLDADTYKLATAFQPINDLNRVTASDVQRVAGRLFKEEAFATVVVGDAAQLKAIPGTSLEVRVTSDSKNAAPTATPPKP